MPIGIWLGRFLPNSALGATDEAFLGFIVAKNIGRMDKLKKSCQSTAAELSYGMGIVVVGQKLFRLRRSKNWNI